MSEGDTDYAAVARKAKSFARREWKSREEYNKKPEKPVPPPPVDVFTLARRNSKLSADLAKKLLSKAADAEEGIDGRIDSASDLAPKLKKEQKAPLNFEQQEKLRKQKRGCIEINRYMSLDKEQRAKRARTSVQVTASPVAAATTTSTKIDQKDMFMETASGFGCCNSAHCNKKKHRGRHCADETYLGLLEQRERNRLSSRKSSLTVVEQATEKRKAQCIDVPPYPFAASTNHAYRGSPITAGTFFKNKAMKRGLASDAELERLSFALLGVFRIYWRERYNIDATYSNDLALLRDQHDDRRASLRREMRVNSGALAEIQAEAQNEAIRLQSCKTEARRLLDMQTELKIGESIRLAGLTKSESIRATLCELMNDYNEHTREEELLARIQAALAGKPVELGFVAPKGRRVPKDSEAADGVASVYDQNVIVPDGSEPPMSLTTPCASQFVVMAKNHACASISVALCARMAMAESDAALRRIDKSPDRMVEEMIDYGAIVRTGTEWWLRRENQEETYQTAMEAISLHRDYFERRFAMKEFGGRMIAETPESWPLADFATAVSLAELRARGATFACTVSYKGATCVLSKQRRYWYVFDSHGTVVADKSVLVRCTSRQAAIDAIFQIFHVPQRGSESMQMRASDGTQAEKLDESGARLQYDMMMFTKKQ